jgi:hypothetical protein
VILRDDTVEPACCISSVSLEELFMELGYRPGAQAVRYDTPGILSDKSEVYLLAFKFYDM